MKRKKLKPSNIIFIAFITIFIVIFLVSLINVIIWFIDNNNTDKQIKNLEEITNIDNIKDNENTEKTIDESLLNESDPYWDFINTDLINVDFNNLKEENSDTVGWIQVQNTNINYPFVKGNDNEFYLRHSFNKSFNYAGWVFMDYRNNKDDFDKNTIIYAHGRVNDSMFGTLRKILSSSWINNPNNYIVKLSTESENTLWQVFSVYRIPTTSDYLDIYFDSNNDFLEFANMLMNRSQYNFNTSLNGNDKILTLSTCYNDNDKVVLHAKLIKREKR